MPQNLLNSYAKFIVVNVNIFFFWIGLLLLGVALYLWIAEWGDGLVKGFFLGAGLTIALLGMIVCAMAFLGCQGVNNQTWKQGYWSGRKVMGIYLTFIITAFVFMVGIVTVALSNADDFAITSDELKADPTFYPELTGMEDFFQDKFNKFFFGASSSCENSMYLWFWHWINDNCDESLRQEYCQGCYYYSPTQCPADESQCFDADIPRHENPACPYTACRVGLLNYFLFRLRLVRMLLLHRKKLLRSLFDDNNHPIHPIHPIHPVYPLPIPLHLYRPFGHSCFAFGVFLIFIALAALMVVCYHPKEDIDTTTSKLTPVCIHYIHYIHYIIHSYTLLYTLMHPSIYTIYTI